MLKNLLIVCIGMALAFHFIPAAYSQRESLVHLSPKNSGDIYLVAQLIVLFYAYQL